MHVIHLRRPWQKRVSDQDAIVSDVPDPDASTGGVEYARRFNTPSGLNRSSRVSLRIESWEGRLERITLNGAALQADASSADWDVTDLLQRNNEVVVRLHGDGRHPARLSGAVTLAIEQS